MRAAILLAALCAPVAAAGASCPDAAADHGRRGAAVAAAEGLEVSRVGQTLRIVATTPDSRINAEAGIVLERRDGSECTARILGGDSRQIRIDLPLSQVSAIEAGICHIAEGVCVPVRIEVPARR